MASQENEIDIFALVRVVWGYKWLVMVVAIVFGLIATALALFATPLYRAEVIVTEVRENGADGLGSLATQLGGLASLAGVNISSGGAGQEAQAVLESRRLIEQFIQRNNLLTQLFPDLMRPPSLWYGVRLFRQEVVTIRKDDLKGTTTVIMEWTDPVTTAQWANGFVALANELVRARAVDEANRNIAYLNEQIERTNVVELRRVMYSLIETETKKLMFANGRAEYAFTVVDPAVPPEIRTSPRRTLMVALGIVLGGVVGVIAALAYNMWAPRRRATAPAV